MSLSSHRRLFWTYAIGLAFALVISLGSPRLSSTPKHPSLLISEIYANTLDQGAPIETIEWVELYNPARVAVNLGGWTIEDSQAIGRLPDIDLPPLSVSLIVGRGSSVTVPAGAILIVLDSADIGTGLRDAGDRVSLVNPFGIRVDSISWGDASSRIDVSRPAAGQAIVRRPNGRVRLSDTPSAWRVEENLRAIPPLAPHKRPDSAVQITSAMVSPKSDQVESVTIRNVSTETLLTINWRLTVGRSLIKLRSVRLDPGEELVITESDDQLGGGLSQSGGHLVLRDVHSRWLATASWGDDESFHRLQTPPRGEPLEFHSHARVHPQRPWWEWISERDLRIVAATDRVSSVALTTEVIAASSTRQRPGYANQESGASGDVWISEVHPSTGQGRNEASFEWFELANVGDSPLDLSGWTISDNQDSDPLDGIILPPGGTTVIAGSADVVADAEASIDDGRIGNGLANSGDRIQLVDPQGVVISAVSWGDDETYSIVSPPDADQSIHLQSPDALPALGPPSPGRVTRPPTESDAPVEPSDSDSLASLETASERDASVPISTVLISEILPAPHAGEAEWVELFNPSDQVVDLSGWSIGDAAGVTPLEGAIAPRSRFLIASQQLDAKSPSLVVDRIGNGLNNDGDLVIILDVEGRVVDEVSYGDDLLPTPARGLSIALQPARWVVTAEPSPGGSDVTPLLADELRSVSAPIDTPDDDRVPVTAAVQEGDSNAWMIVSIGLIGVILTLLVRRWRPAEDAADHDAPATSYSGPDPRASGNEEADEA